MDAMIQSGGEDIVARMNGLLALQRGKQTAEGPPSAETRIDRLNRAIALLVDHRQALVDAIEADFGARSKDASLLADIAATLATLKHARAKTRAWMRPERRSPDAPFGLLGAKAEVRFQPKGVVGVISPWNFPVNLTFGPLAGVFAAGNRAMIKPSELTPETSALMQSLVAKAFGEEELVVITGGPEVGAAFAGLAFDHLLFTGGTAVGRHVMRAAAQNLTPVTLELGGKSPVLLSRSADVAKSAARIMAGKTLNAGQICLAPDYVLTPRDRAEGFAEAASQAVKTMFPTGLKDNPDYGAIINQRHYERVRGLIEDAKAKGARIVEINPAGEDFSQQEHRKIPPTLVFDATDDMAVMQEEIFGPVMPVVTYETFPEAIAYVNAHARPLGLYYFGEDAGEREMALQQTVSGGVTVNDVIGHFTQEELPMGGIGPAGMGAYHGRDGFLEFSHKKAIYQQTALEVLAIARPPYGPKLRGLLAQRVTK